MGAVEDAVRRRTFHTLDGLRGVAAIAVALFHLGLFKPLTLPSAYLAVDLFFLMSGVVIAHSYEKRLSADLTLGKFFLTRWIRLLPLYLVGYVVIAGEAGIALVLGLSQNWTWATFLPSAGTAALLIPNVLPSRKTSLYPFNPPAWSLFWEMLINLAYAMVLPLLSVRVLKVIVVTAGIALLFVCSAYGKLDFGYDWKGWPVGLVRVIFSFTLGVLFARLLAQGRLVRVPRVPPAILLAVALGVFALPVSLSWPKDAVAVLLIFPLVTIAALEVEPRWTRFYTFLGLISYPIYTIHAAIPMSRIDARMVRWTGQPTLILFDGALLTGLLAASWALARWYDPVVRAALTRALLHRRQRSSASMS